MSEATITWKFFYPKYLAIKKVESSSSAFHIQMVSETKTAVCPVCGKRTRKELSDTRENQYRKTKAALEYLSQERTPESVAKKIFEVCV